MQGIASGFQGYAKFLGFWGSHGFGSPHRLTPNYTIHMEVLYGVHPVEEALRAGKRRFDQVLVARERQDERLTRLVAECRQSGVRVRQETREQLTQLAGTAAHQGVVAMVRPQEFLAIEDLFDAVPGST